MRSGFERMTSGITSVISLKFCTKSFENVQYAIKFIYEDSSKPIKKNCKLKFRPVFHEFEWRPQTKKLQKLQKKLILSRQTYNAHWTGLWKKKKSFDENKTDKMIDRTIER